MADSVETNENRQPIGGTNGGILKRNADYANVTSITITVSDADRAIQDVINAGGTLVRKKEKFGNIGYVAYVKDTEGNVPRNMAISWSHEVRLDFQLCLFC